MASWKNWAKTVEHKDLEKVYEPKSLAELKAAVNHAASRGWKLRVVGKGHAWSNLGLPGLGGGAVIRTQKLNKILTPDDEIKQALLVEVEAGISIRSLNNRLHKLGVALKNMGDSNPQAVAGAIATETHGSGAGVGSMSEFVEGMRIVTADGSVRDLAGDELKAGRVSLGLLGAVYSIKLRVRPKFFLRHEQTTLKFRDENISGLLGDPEWQHLEYWYYPYTGNAERILRKEVNSTEIIDLLDLAEEWFIKIGAIHIRELGERNPEKIPKFLIDHVEKGKIGFKDITRQGPSHKILLGKSNVWRRVLKTYTMEYQFALGAGDATFWSAFDALEESIALAAQKRVFVSSPIQIRFTKKSTKSLLTHLRHAPTASFSISMFRSHKGVHTWMPELERRLLALGARPHWGKMYYTEPSIDAKRTQFEQIRETLDPTGMFNFRQGPYTPDPDAFQDP